MGIRGQAGQLDWIDGIAAVMEVGLDPANLLGIGAAAKGATAAKTARIAKELNIPIEALETARKGTKIAEDVIRNMPEESANIIKAVTARSGGTIAEDMLPHIIQRAEELLAAEPGTTFLRYGIGKNVVTIPGTNILLEGGTIAGKQIGLLPAGRALRRSAFGKWFSTQAETPLEALQKAALQIGQDYKAGAMRQAGMHWRAFGRATVDASKFTSDSTALRGVQETMATGLDFKEAAEEYLFRAMESKPDIGRKMLQGAPDEMFEIFETNNFLQEIAPAIDAKARLATVPFQAPDLLEQMEAGLGRELAENYTPLLLDRDYLDYLKANDDMWGKRVFGRNYSGTMFRTAGFYQKARTIPDTVASMNQMMRETGKVIYKFSRSAELGKYAEKGPKELGQLKQLIDSKVYFDDLGAYTVDDIVAKHVEKGTITAEEAARMYPKKLGKYFEYSPKTEKIWTYIEGEIPDYTDIAQILRKAVPEATDEELQLAYRNLIKQGKEAVDQKWANSTSEYIENWLIDNIEMAGPEKVIQDVRKSRRMNKYLKEIQSVLDLTDNQARMNTLLKNSYEVKKFKRMYSTNWGQNMGLRMGEGYLNRSVSGLLQVVMKNPHWAQKIARTIEGEGRVAIDDIVKQAIKEGKTGDEIEALIRPRLKEMTERCITGRRGDISYPDPAEAAVMRDVGWGSIVDKLPAKFKEGLSSEFTAELSDYVFSPEALNMIDKSFEMVYDIAKADEAMTAFGKFMSMMRASTILPFAGYHINNAFGNRWGRYLERTTLRLDADAHAITVMKAVKSGVDEDFTKVLTKVEGKDFTVAQALNEALHNDVLTGGRFTQEILQGVYKLGEPTDELVSMWARLNPAGRQQYGAYLARTLEDHDRLAHYIARRSMGDSVDEAVRSVERALFRYEDLSKVEKGARPYLFFPTWYRKNMGLTLQKLWEYPGRMSLPLKLRNTLNGIFGEAESEYAVPQYLSDNLYFYFGTDPNTGEALILDPEKWLPPLSAGKFLADPLKEGLSMLIPPLKLALEAGVNKNIFTGREIKEAKGQLAPFMGGEIDPRTAHFLSNWRILTAINRTLFPGAEREEGEYIRPGQAGARTTGERGLALGREWGGFKLTRTDAQRNRFYAVMTQSTGIGGDLATIERKMAGNITETQRESYLRSRSRLLWDKANVLQEMIADGRDPFTGKPMKWEPPMPKVGKKPKGMRDYHSELYGTLKDIFFGEPPVSGQLTVPIKNRLSATESSKVYEMLVKTKLDLLNRDMEYAIENKNQDVFDDRVLGPIRDIIKTPTYYIREKRAPGAHTYIYDYPLPFRQSLVSLYDNFLRQAREARLINSSGYKARRKTFRTKYEVDYR